MPFWWFFIIYESLNFLGAFVIIALDQARNAAGA